MSHSICIAHISTYFLVSDMEYISNRWNFMTHTHMTNTNYCMPQGLCPLKHNKIIKIHYYNSDNVIYH